MAVVLAGWDWPVQLEHCRRDGCRWRLAAAVRIRVAVRALAPEKRTLGVVVVWSDRVTPVFGPLPDLGARLQSAVVTPLPEMASGTSMMSPAIRAGPG